jgi:hypothetical protein
LKVGSKLLSDRTIYRYFGRHDAARAAGATIAMKRRDAVDALGAFVLGGLEIAGRVSGDGDIGDEEA